jgi:hypothetical protein
MLNLSDKELDRFSKEAAQEYEPGDVLGERAWERMEIRLDRDLGRVHPNLLRHIRRFPFYYAPAMLLLLGVSYYLTKRSGGPPLSAAKAPTAVVQYPYSTQSPANTDKSTPPSSNATATTSVDQTAGTAVSSGAGAAAGTSTGASSAAGSSNAAGTHVAAGANAAAGANTAGSRGSAGAAAAGANTSAGAEAGTGVDATAGFGVNASASVSRRHRGKNGRGDHSDNTLAVTAPANAGQRVTAGQNSSTVAAAGVAGQQAPEKELGRTTLQGLRPTKKVPYINDSALRAFTLKSTAPQLIRKGGAHINRSLELGVLLAPDFASVNSLAGDRPGSTIGLTVDYQFASHWYVGSGLLLDRKIFAARGGDFHAPPHFYSNNGMPDGADLVKGSFEMLEIPLNLRYDFSVSGSTLFFVSSGISSYLLTSENNNYYYRQPYTQGDICQSISSPDKSYLFSALNLSVGVETGLSNSLSLLIAPYMKIPVRGVGIGQVQMSTVGINFSLKFAPIISRKRY